MTRLPHQPAEVIDRNRTITFFFDGKKVTAKEGDTIASALYVAGRRTFSRSFKYHRRRGLMCCSGHCPNCLVAVDGAPGIRACTEPARDGGKIVTARKGIGAFIVHIHGRPAHSGSNPDKGRSAIAAMAELVLAIGRMSDPPRGVTTNVGLINGGTARNTVAEDCMIEVDLRFSDRASASALEANVLALKSSRPDIETTVTGRITRPPFVREKIVDLVFDQAAAIAQEIGFKLESTAPVGGGSDGNFTVAMGIPTLDGLGVDGDGAHTNEEYLKYSSIEPRTRLMQGLMERLS